MTDVSVLITSAVQENGAVFSDNGAMTRSNFSMNLRFDVHLALDNDVIKM